MSKAELTGIHILKVTKPKLDKIVKIKGRGKRYEIMDDIFTEYLEMLENQKTELLYNNDENKKYCATLKYRQGIK